MLSTADEPESPDWFLIPLKVLAVTVESVSVSVDVLPDVATFWMPNPLLSPIVLLVMVAVVSWISICVLTVDDVLFVTVLAEISSVPTNA
jgi:hypothetical protein